MKKTFNLFLLLLLFWNIQLQAQKIPKSFNLVKDGKREGAWTIWMDKEWAPTASVDSVAYYRQITYEGGNPVGQVKDFYRNGKIQWEGFLVTDQPSDVINGVTTWYFENGSKQEVAEYKNGVKISTTFFNDNGSVDDWNTLDAQGIIYHEQGNYKKALKTFTESRAQAAKEFGTQSIKFSRALTNIGLVHSDMGAYEKAEEYFIQSLAILKVQYGEDDPEYATGLDNLATTHKALGKYETAEPLFEEALQIRKTKLGEDHLEYAESLNSMGIFYQLIGRYEKAEASFLKALQIRKSHLGENDLYYISSISNLALLYRDMDIYDRAESYFLLASERYKASLGEKHLYYAISLYNLALLYMDTGKYAEAELLFIRSSMIYKEQVGETTYYGTALMSLGSLNRKLFKYEKAEAFNRESLQILKEQLGENSIEYAVGLVSMANLFKDFGRFDKAESIFIQALKIIKDRLGENHIYYSGSLIKAASLYQEMGKYQEADFTYNQAVKIFLVQIETYFPFLSEKEKEQFYITIKNAFDKFHSYAIFRFKEHPQILGEVFNLQLFTKGLLLNSNAKWKQRIRNSDDKELISLYVLWEGKQTRIAKLINETDSLKRMTLDSLLLQANAIEKELSKRSELFTHLSDKKRFAWQDVQKQLRPGEASIEMVRCNKFGIKAIATDSSNALLTQYPQYGLTDTIYYAALIVTKASKQPGMVIFKNGNELEKKGLSYYRTCLTFQIKDEKSYELFWKSIAETLGGKIKKIYFSPDGVYNSINLNTLYNPKSKKYILEEIDLQLVTNTKDPLIRVNEDNINKVAYLFGYPNYQTSRQELSTPLDKNLSSGRPVYYSLSLQRASKLIDLPGTRVEVENVAALLSAKGWKPEVHTGNNALEKTLKNSVKPRVLHIATHGYFQPDSALSTRANPLLQSGLMLAGAGRTLEGHKDEATEDGILTAFEAMNLNLDNTDLVVLSACETGLGEIRNGEGVYGLQRAFKVAGAKSIIMSLWKVNDEATQELLTAFYKFWLESGNKRDAFKKAQLNIKTKYPNPFFWGAFVMAGE